MYSIPAYLYTLLQLIDPKPYPVAPLSSLTDDFMWTQHERILFATNASSEQMEGRKLTSTRIVYFTVVCGPLGEINFSPAKSAANNVVLMICPGLTAQLQGCGLIKFGCCLAREMVHHFQ